MSRRGTFICACLALLVVAASAACGDDNASSDQEGHATTSEPDDGATTLTIDAGQLAAETIVTASAGETIRVEIQSPVASAGQSDDPDQFSIGFAAGAETYARALAQAQSETEEDPYGDEHQLVLLDDSVDYSYGPEGATGGGFQFTPADQACVAWVAPVDGDYAITLFAQPPGGPATVDVIISTEPFADFDPAHPVESIEDYDRVDPAAPFDTCFLL